LAGLLCCEQEADLPAVFRTLANHLHGAQPVARQFQRANVLQIALDGVGVVDARPHIDILFTDYLTVFCVLLIVLVNNSLVAE
jgi:hypothetical protein